MCESLTKLIHQYERGAMGASPYLEILEQIRAYLKEAIENTFRGEKVIYFQRYYIFKLEYMTSQEQKNNGIPTFVSYKNDIRNFNSAIDLLLDYYCNKIRKIEEKTIRELARNIPKGLKDYIKYGMALQLMNREELFKTTIKNAVTIPDERENNEGDTYRITDKQRAKTSMIFENYEYSIEDLYDLKINIENQKEAFFWIPGMAYNGKIIKAKKAVYIAFFYSFLRENSFATYTEIGREAGGLSATAPSRDWLPHRVLESPFKVNMRDIIYPVFFSEESRGALGIYDRKVSRYQGACDSHWYKKIEKKKNMMWNVYKYLLNIDFIHDHLKLEKGTIDLPSDDGFSLYLELSTTHDLGLRLNKQPHGILLIKSIGQKTE
jgi:hypothetical protein